MKRRGTTLIELLVVVSIFALLISMILGFYIYAYRVSGSRDRLSTAYRRMTATMDRVETMLGSSRVIYANASEIVFTQMNATQPLLKGGWPNWDPPTTLAVLPRKGQGPQLVTRSNSRTNVVANLGPKEAINFGAGGSPAGSGVTGALDSVSMQMTVDVPPENGVGQDRTYSLVRTVVLERP